MPTLAQVQTLIDQRITAQVTGVTVVKTNADDSAAFSAAAPFIKFKVQWGEIRQMDLGNPTPSRGEGALSALIYAPKSKGPATRNELIQKIETAFRSASFGGVVCQNLTLLPDREYLTWNVTSLQVPFFFDNR